MNNKINQLKTCFPRISSVLIVMCFLNMYLSVASSVPKGMLQGDLRKITGVIVDKGGEPIIGANIIVEGAKTGTVSDVDGSFSFSVPEKGGRLVVTYLGFEDLFVPLTGQTRYVLVMNENATVLEDVVVVGYGVQKKESVVGAISQVGGGISSKHRYI